MRRIQLNENQLRRLMRSIINENENLGKESFLTLDFTYFLADQEDKNKEKTHKDVMDNLDSKLEKFGKVRGPTKNTLNFFDIRNLQYATGFASIAISGKDAGDLQIQRQIWTVIEKTFERHVTKERVPQGYKPLEISFQFTDSEGKKNNINPQF
jgi:hypothetical protein